MISIGIKITITVILVILILCFFIRRNRKALYNDNELHSLLTVLSSITQYAIETLSVIFMLVFGAGAIWNIIHVGLLLWEGGDSFSLEKLLTGIEYLFIAPIPWAISGSYLRIQILRFRRYKDVGGLYKKDFKAKQLFIGALIGIVFTNAFKILVKKPQEMIYTKEQTVLKENIDYHTEKDTIVFFDYEVIAQDSLYQKEIKKTYSKKPNNVNKLLKDKNSEESKLSMEEVLPKEIRLWSKFLLHMILLFMLIKYYRTLHHNDNH